METEHDQLSLSLAGHGMSMGQGLLLCGLVRQEL